MKALLVFGMSAITATSIVGFAACESGDGTGTGTGTGSGEGTHQHTWSDWSDNGDGTHSRECTAEGHEGEKKETADHKDANSDKVCDDCGISLGTENPTPSTKEVVTWSVDEDFKAATLTEEKELKEGMGVFAGSGLVFDASSGKKYTYAGEDKAPSANRVKFNGDGTTTSKYLRVNVKEDATVIVYGWSGTTNKVANLKMLDKDGQDVQDSLQKVNDGSNSEAWAAVFEVKANTNYYIVSYANGGANAIFNFVAVDYNFKETFTDVAAKSEDCENDGNKAYSVSDYGRYKDAEGTLVSPDSVKIPKKGHSYAVKDGTLNLPTAENVGSVSLVCANDSTHELPIELPTLDSTLYGRVDATGDDAGKTVYTYKSNGVDIVFTADKVAEKVATYTTIYSNDFNTALTIPNGSATATSDRGVKIFGTTDGEWGETLKLAAVGGDTGVLEVIDTSNAATTNGFIAFDEAKTSGVYKITGKIKLGNVGSKWNFIHLVSDINEASVADSDSFASIRLNSDKKAVVYTNNATEHNAVLGSVSKGTEYTFEIIVDMDHKTVTVKMNDGFIGSNDPISFTLDEGKGFKGIRLQTAKSATDRKISLDDLVIAKQD